MCQVADCGHPAEVVLVVVAVNTVDASEGEPVTRQLCSEHADLILYLVREAGGT